MEVYLIPLLQETFKHLLTNLGNVFPGATLPYGMAKAVADTDSDSNQGGFTLDASNITGFSSM